MKLSVWCGESACRARGKKTGRYNSHVPPTLATTHCLSFARPDQSCHTRGPRAEHLVLNRDAYSSCERPVDAVGRLASVYAQLVSTLDPHPRAMASVRCQAHWWDHWPQRVRDDSTALFGPSSFSKRSGLSVLARRGRSGLYRSVGETVSWFGVRRW